MDKGEFVKAYEAFVALDGYRDSAEKANSIYNKSTVMKLKSAKVGEYISFGEYEQDNNTSNGKEAIEWLVLEAKEDKVFVISKIGLEHKRYNIMSTDVTWETCDLRSWLNMDFINSAFSLEEKSAIATVTVSADENSRFTTNPGIDTQDQVFLLSISEFEKYIDYNNAVCVDTDSFNSAWWLRTPGFTQSYAAYIHNDGSVNFYGNNGTNSYAVRPAMWIDISKIGE